MYVISIYYMFIKYYVYIILVAFQTMHIQSLGRFHLYSSFSFSQSVFLSFDIYFSFCLFCFGQYMTLYYHMNIFCLVLQSLPYPVILFQIFRCKCFRLFWCLSIYPTSLLSAQDRISVCFFFVINLSIYLLWFTIFFLCTLYIDFDSSELAFYFFNLFFQVPVGKF